MAEFAREVGIGLAYGIVRGRLGGDASDEDVSAALEAVLGKGDYHATSRSSAEALADAALSYIEEYRGGGMSAAIKKWQRDKGYSW